MTFTAFDTFYELNDGRKRCDFGKSDGNIFSFMSTSYKTNVICLKI
jgi:hypothetical protein